MLELAAAYVLGELFGQLGAVIERAMSASRRQRREQRQGLRLIWSSDRKLDDVLMLDGPHAGKRISELHPETVLSLQKIWPRLTGRFALARWLDRNRPGWRQQRRNAFIPEGPAR